jgi:enoyl-CoA hydratase/carnithine racemase
MDYETIEYKVQQEGLGILSLNRPRKFNMVNHRMMEELEDFWRERLYDLDTHVVILRGNGKRAFCAGLDMREAMKMMQDMNLDQFYRFQARLARLNLAMRRVPVRSKVPVWVSVSALPSHRMFVW